MDFINNLKNTVMQNIIANSIEEVLSILSKNSDENTDFDFENPNDPCNSRIIEYDLKNETSIEWSWTRRGNEFSFFC